MNKKILHGTSGNHIWKYMLNTHKKKTWQQIVKKSNGETITTLEHIVIYNYSTLDFSDT